MGIHRDEQMEKIWSKTAERDCSLSDFLLYDMELTKRQVKQAKFRKDGIRVNSNRARVTHELKAGDKVEVKLEEAHTGSSQLVPGKGIPDILYEDEDLLCVNKPAGLVVHPSHGHYADSLSNMLAFYFREKGVQARVRSVGRAWMGHPLLGDRLYGGNTEHMKRAALHAFRVTLIQPFTEEEIRIQAAFPDDMQKCLEAKRSEIK